jgi:hypothetical protein
MTRQPPLRLRSNFSRIQRHRQPFGKCDTAVTRVLIANARSHFRNRDREHADRAAARGARKSQRPVYAVRNFIPRRGRYAGK